MASMIHHPKFLPAPAPCSDANLRNLCFINPTFVASLQKPQSISYSLSFPPIGLPALTGASVAVTLPILRLHRTIADGTLRFANSSEF
ncbi:hypothetical protein Nepgr_015402 [Nepenthes gracilis]|uniref:Uncharacterized protein n=1 Tax=Nepenthes gracilis TaxID=150966 RepID=A0AAD3XR95_NEPGR|nr:hypothetical protein Nepgr_015402 [Nepenthes gracilis]